MQFKIQETEKHELIHLAPLIKSNKAAYSSIEQDQLYALYNRIFGQKKTPNGCSACMRSTINSLKKALQIVEAV